jgi:hypothetical protein
MLAVAAKPFLDMIWRASAVVNSPAYNKQTGGLFIRRDPVSHAPGMLTFP